MNVTSGHIARWVAFYRGFSDESRAGLARQVSAVNDAPRSIVEAICRHPDRLLAVVEAADLDLKTRALLENLVLDHDLPQDPESDDLESLLRLHEIGIINKPEGEPVMVPAGIAAVLAPVVKGVHTSAVTLFGSKPKDELARVAAAYGVQRETEIETVLSLAEVFGSEDVGDQVAKRLPDLEYFGAPMVAIELGGVCYWQEVFGVEMSVSDPDSTVVPFMRRDERHMEVQIAQTLEDLGVVHRINHEPHPLLVIPEELWQPLWELGRTWLGDWVADTFDGLEEQGTARPDAVVRASLQTDLKWLACLDTAQNGLKELDKDPDWSVRVGLGLEISAVSRNGAGLESQRLFDSVLTLPRQQFARQILLDWCTGYAGSAADANMGRAIGLDRVWRDIVMESLESASEFVPLWMRGEAVDPEGTGTGCLRNTSADDGELLELEFGLVNGLVWSQKLVWLDLMSMFSADYWYPIAQITDLLQMVCAWSTFNRVAHILENPDIGFYLPVQRASLVTDPFHADEFTTWVQDVFAKLLVPLGVASISEDGKTVCVDPLALRVPSPPTVGEDERESVIQSIFGADNIAFRIPPTSNGFLRPVAAELSGDAASIDEPIQQLREWVNGRVIIERDGKTIRLEPLN